MELSQKRAHSWVGQAVFALDRWLRRRQGSFEFSSRPECLFRIEPCVADQAIVLADGTQTRPGELLLRLHLWNENMPRMGRRGPTFGWARQTSRALDMSLRELAHYLSRHPDLVGVRLAFGDMSLATPRQTQQFQRLIARFGFQARAHPAPRGALRRLGESILVLLLILATNPIALRRGLRHYRSRVFLPREVLELRYGGGACRARARLPAAQRS